MARKKKSGIITGTVIVARIVYEKNIKLSDCINQDCKKVLLVCNHGIGDVISFKAVFNSIKCHWPQIHFDLGLNHSMGYEKIIPESVLVDDLNKFTKEYDIIFIIKYSLEDFSKSNLTKSEKCCVEEIGIPPVSFHTPIKVPPLVGVHFHSSCLPKQLGCPEDTAKLVWEDIGSCGCVPIETHFLHRFHHPENVKFKFIDLHCRGFAARTDHLAALISSCYAFVGVISGNLHIALSVLPHSKIFVLVNEMKSSQITKLPVASAQVHKYNGEVKKWLSDLMNK